MWHKRPTTKVVEPGDHGFWNDLWRTREFRNLLEDPSTGYANLINQATLRPWWFVDASESYERYHFSIWLGDTFLRREYDNPVITDLYYFHDLLHALTFRQLDEQVVDHEQWRLAMRANEIAVSIETEMFIYLRNPALRVSSFADRIWIDDLTDPLPPGLATRLNEYSSQLLNDVDFAACEQALFDALPNIWPLFHPISALKQGRPFRWFWDLRRAVTLNPDPDSAVEMALHRYENQANPFYAKWTNHWREVEDSRLDFAKLCSTGQWSRAVSNRHAQWESMADANGVPYGDLAPRPRKKKVS